MYVAAQCTWPAYSVLVYRWARSCPGQVDQPPLRSNASRNAAGSGNFAQYTVRLSHAPAHGSVYVTGYTQSTNFPTASPLVV